MIFHQYEQNCADNQYYPAVMERLEVSPRFCNYSSEIEHLLKGIEQFMHGRGAGSGVHCNFIQAHTDCDTIWQNSFHGNGLEQNNKI